MATHKDSVNDPPTDGHARGPSTALVFAPDPATGAALKALLAGPSGPRIYPAMTLEAAMEIFTAVRVNLLILAPSSQDEGLQHLRALLGSDRQRRVPIVVRAPQGADHLHFLRAGADDAVSPDDSDAELVARVGRLLARERERETQAMARRYSLAGDLTGLGLSDLITVLEHGALTGSLELLTRRGAAQLLIREGQIKYASFGNTRGRVAFFELLREREGQFEFAPGEWTTTDTSAALEGPTSSLLLEGSQAMDENPDESAAVVARPAAQETSRVVPALRPDPEVAVEWLLVMRDSAALGEMRLLAREQVRHWTALPNGGKRLRLTLIIDVACAVHVVSHLAASLAQEEIVNSLQRPPAALGVTWKLASGHTLELLLLDQERLRTIADVVLGSPAVFILAPMYGDFMTYSMSARATLQRLLHDVNPSAILAVGNQALEAQVGMFLKLAQLEFPTQVIRGSLWKLEVTPRALLEAAIRQWAEVPAAPGRRAA